MNNMSFEKFAKLMRRKSKVILTFAIISFLAGIFYATVFFKPSYKSEAKFLIKDTMPILTQIEILKSNSFAEKVWQNINQKHKLSENNEFGAEFIKKSINVKNPANTNVIIISAKWRNPEVAKDVAEEFSKAYISSNKTIAKQEIIEGRDIIEKQLKKAETELQKTRQRIKEFKIKNSIIDLKAESESIVNQIASLENKYNYINSLAYADIINNNPRIIEIQNKLTNLEQEQTALATKYTDYHPAKIAVDKQIDNLKRQLENQIGNTSPYKSIQAQASKIKRTIRELEVKRAEIPQRQMILDNAIQNETNWANIVNVLKAEQAETIIKEAKAADNITLIETPAIPLHCSFPNRAEIIVLFTLIGALLSVASITISAIVKNTCDNIEQMENELNTTVFGVVPWLDEEAYNAPGIAFAMDESSSFYSLAYQRIVSSLRIKGYNTNTNALAFTSSEFSKFRSTIIMNTAYGLSKTGQSVVIVDADFRTPSISLEFGLRISEKFNLSELISEISREKKHTGSFNFDKLNYFIKEIPKTDKLHIIPNTGNVSDPCEFLHSPSFNLLIRELKQRYDWVLVDVPPALAVPDALTVGSSVDGVILVTGLDTNRAVLKKIYKQFKSCGIPIFGAIAREIQLKESALSNEYIKQILPNMISQDEALFQE